MTKLKIKEIPTLKQLYDMTDKMFVCVGTNITKLKTDYFNYINHPNIKCTDSVKISCNIPLVFQKIKYNGCYYVDGAMVNNFAVDYANKKTNKILGIYLPNTKPPSAEEFGGYLASIIMTMQAEMNRVRMRDIGDNVTIVTICGEKGDMLEVSMSSDKKMKMFLTGYKIGKMKDSDELIQVEDWEPSSSGKSEFNPNKWNIDGWEGEWDDFDLD